jgi:type II secretory pathway predicted ATPase ExeA
MKDLKMDFEIEMALAFYGLRVKPFQPSTDPKFLRLGRAHREILSNLKSGILRNEGLLVLTGDVGTGKTTLANALLEDLGDGVIVARVLYPSIGPLDFLEVIADACGIGGSAGSPEAFRHRFEQFLEDAGSRGKRVLLVIDEAQSLSRELFPEIGHLANIGKDESNRLNILLVGQDELNTILSEPENAALKKRIKIRGTTGPLTHPEVGQYVQHRLKMAGADRRLFTAGAIREMAVFSEGIPRLINTIGDLALMSGYGRSAETIHAEIVKECALRLGRPGRNGETGRKRREAAPVSSAEEEERAGTASRPDAALDGDGRALEWQPSRGEDRETIRRRGEAAPVPSAEEKKRAGPAGGIARYAALFVLLLAVAGYLYYPGRSPDQRPSATPRKSSDAPRESGRSVTVVESAVQPAPASEPDTEALRMRQRPVGVLPPSAAVTLSKAPPTKVAAEEKQEATERVPDPASVGSVARDERRGAGGRVASQAAREQGASVAPPARRAGGSAAGGVESVDPGEIIDWLLNEYAARRQ